MKEIRANLMLDWLCTNFPELRLLIVVRHPLAVATSRVKLGWPTVLAQLAAQDYLFHDHVSAAQVALMDLCNSKVEQAVWQWCLETAVALRSARRFDIPVVAYENVRATEQAAWQLCETVAPLLAERKPGRIEWRRPSGMTAKTWASAEATYSRNVVSEVLRSFSLDGFHDLGNWSAGVDERSLKANGACLN